MYIYNLLDLFSCILLFFFTKRDYIILHLCKLQFKISNIYFVHYPILMFVYCRFWGCNISFVRMHLNLLIYLTDLQLSGIIFFIICIWWQWYVDMFPGENKGLICNVCQIPWCKYFHHDWFCFQLCNNWLENFLKI